MNVFRKDGYIKASCVTGPMHNFLGLKIGTPASGCPRLEPKEVPSIGRQRTTLEGEDIRATVEDAIAEFNAQNGTDLAIEAIEYVVSDTPDMKAYRLLTFAIANSAMTEPGGRA